MITILKQLQKQEITKTNKDGEIITYHDYICPKFKKNEYLALTVKGKLCHPSTGKPYITRNIRDYLFHELQHSNNNVYAMVLVSVDDTALCTLLSE